MIDDFAQPAWAAAHEAFAAKLDAGFARLARWLGRRAKAKEETAAVTQAGDRPKLRKAKA